MKSNFRILTALAMAAAAFGVSAQSSIPTPASSASAGGRAVVAITQMSASDVTNVVNQSISSGQIAIPNSGSAYDRPWTSYLIGSVKCNGGWCGTIRSDGAIAVTRNDRLQDVSGVPYGLFPLSPLSCHNGVWASPLGHNYLQGTPPTDWTFSYGFLNDGCGA